MLKMLKIRTIVLTVHGVLAVSLGLTLLYIHGSMTNVLFDVVDVGVALWLSVAMLILGALTDWIAAISEGVRHFHRFTFYLLGGLGLVLSGLFLAYYPYGSMSLLLLFAAVHATAFSISILIFGLKSPRRSPRRRAVYVNGTISLLFAISMAILATRNDDPSAIAALGAYLCFVGAKMLFFAWDLHRTTEMEEKAADTATPVNVLVSR